ncbi:hypothetical protein KAM546c_31220 [Enterobacter roggenkampii]|nr:hypothetical protein KAM546c_31220 [Enterobacter roggenkampii]
MRDCPGSVFLGKVWGTNPHRSPLAVRDPPKNASTFGPLSLEGEG